MKEHPLNTLLRVASWSAPLGFCLYACGGGESLAPTAHAVAGNRSTEIRHEACDDSGSTKLDANGDGKADIRRVFKGSVEVCRVSDLDFDGKDDSYAYFDGAGNLRRRELDLDGNGKADMVETFEGGRLTIRELDTSGRGRVDTWDFFDASGANARRERDLDGDGHVDQYWVWEQGKISVMQDRNADGKPDQDTAILWDGEHLISPTAAKVPAPSATASATASAPETQPAPSAQPTPASTAPGDSADAGAADAAKPKRARK